jgi:hypothetical protein
MLPRKRKKENKLLLPTGVSKSAAHAVLLPFPFTSDITESAHIIVAHI